MTHGQWRTGAIVLAGALTFLMLHLFFILTWSRFFIPTAWPGYEASAAAGLIEPWFVNTPASLWLTRIVFFAATVALTLFIGGRTGATALAYFAGAAVACAALWATTRGHAVAWGWLGFILYPFRLLLPIVIAAALAPFVRRLPRSIRGESG